MQEQNVRHWERYATRRLLNRAAFVLAGATSSLIPVFCSVAPQHPTSLTPVLARFRVKVEVAFDARSGSEVVSMNCHAGDYGHQSLLCCGVFFARKLTPGAAARWPLPEKPSRRHPVD
jgi:hypothetical protein